MEPVEADRARVPRAGGSRPDRRGLPPVPRRRRARRPPGGPPPTARPERPGRAPGGLGGRPRAGDGRPAAGGGRGGPRWGRLRAAGRRQDGGAQLGGRRGRRRGLVRRPVRLGAARRRSRGVAASGAHLLGVVLVRTVALLSVRAKRRTRRDGRGPPAAGGRPRVGRALHPRPRRRARRGRRPTGRVLPRPRRRARLGTPRPRASRRAAGGSDAGRFDPCRRRTPDRRRRQRPDARGAPPRARARRPPGRRMEHRRRGTALDPPVAADHCGA